MAGILADQVIKDREQGLARPVSDEAPALVRTLLYDGGLGPVTIRSKCGRWQRRFWPATRDSPACDTRDVVSKKTDSTPRELAAIQLATSDLVGVALRSVEGLEVSLPQFRLLRVLDELGEASATRCAEVLRVGASSITRLVDRLDASGHLVRRTDPANRSAVVLALSEEGRRLVRKVESRRRRELGRALERLRPEERSQCIAALERLHEVLQAPEDPRIPY